jgi:hypothetical protein
MPIAAAPKCRVRRQWSLLVGYPRSGPPYPIAGVPDFDASSYKAVNASTVEMTRTKDGKAVQTQTRVMSADGKTLTFTATGTNAKGQQVNNIAIYDKQ